MTTTPEKEPTLADVLDKIEKLSDKIDRSDERIAKLADNIDRSDIRFEAYRNATQQIVNLAFGLIASATVIVIVRAIIDR